MKEKDFRIEELRIVRVIAETASVSKAAQLLDMPQSNVSRALTTLERRLDWSCSCAARALCH